MKKFMYICDRMKCGNCNHRCKYTDDILHAAYKDKERRIFKKGVGGAWEEQDYAKLLEVEFKDNLYFAEKRL